MRQAVPTLAPYYLTSIAYLSFWLAGHERTRGVGWLLCMLVLEPSWMVYGVMTHTLGWVLTAIPFVAIYGRNYWRSRRESSNAKSAAESVTVL